MTKRIMAVEKVRNMTNFWYAGVEKVFRVRCVRGTEAAGYKLQTATGSDRCSGGGHSYLHMDRPQLRIQHSHVNRYVLEDAVQPGQVHDNIQYPVDDAAEVWARHEDKGVHDVEDADEGDQASPFIEGQIRSCNTPAL